VNPKVFKIINGKLYLNYNDEAAAKFESDAAENINKADENWGRLSQK
jgi:hypothetical protein